MIALSSSHHHHQRQPQLSEPHHHRYGTTILSRPPQLVLLRTPSASLGFPPPQPRPPQVAYAPAPPSFAALKSSYASTTSCSSSTSSSSSSWCTRLDSTELSAVQALLDLTPPERRKCSPVPQLTASTGVSAAVSQDSSSFSSSTDEEAGHFSDGSNSEAEDRDGPPPTCNVAAMLLEQGPALPASDGGICLALDSDEDFLSPLHCFMRRHCVEAFVANPADAAAVAAAAATTTTTTTTASTSHSPSHGRVAPGQVGIRCLHCKHRSPHHRAERAVCYPSTLKNVYHSIETWQRRHSLVCRDIPSWVKRDLAALVQTSRSGAGGRRAYWEAAARRVGLVDTPRGIRCIVVGRSTTAEGQAGRSPSLLRAEAPSSSPVRPTTTALPTSGGTTAAAASAGRPVVEPEDRELVTDYLFLLLDQMEACAFTEEDRAGGRSKVKDCPVGFPGMQCKHCGGKAGFGRYFPATPGALTSANSDRNIYNHLLKCRRCPEHVRHQLIQAGANRLHHTHTHTHPHRGGDHNSSDGHSSSDDCDAVPILPHHPKNRRGSRKVFFQRVWGRLHP